MDPRGALAQLFLAGRSPEEQAQRMARQRQQSGVGGGAAPPALDMTQPGPWGAGRDPMTTGSGGGGAPMGGAGVPIPTPRPDPVIQFPPDLGVSPQMPPDPMAASAPTNATLPFVPGSSRMPPDLGVSPLMPPDPMAASAPTNNPPPPMEMAPSPARPPDPMAASAPTEIGGYEAKKQFGLSRAKKKSRKEQTKDSQDKFKKQLPTQFGLS